MPTRSLRTFVLTLVPAAALGALLLIGPGPGATESRAFAGAGQPKDDAKPAGRRVALLVGIAKYDSEIGDLMYSENDVNDLAEVLKGGGYKADDVIVMTTTAGQTDKTLLPTAANIMAKLDAVLKGLRKDDLVMVAFAGHGVQPAGGKAQFCGYQAKLNDPKTMVVIDDVVTAMNKSAATTKILLVDACRDTPGSRAPKPFETAVVDVPTVTGKDGTATIAYFSCDKGEKSWEVDELKHGVFFAQLIDGLRGEADAYPDGQITWNELVGYVERKVNFRNAEFGGRKQTPHFRGEVRNAAPLVVLPGAGKVDVSRAVEGVRATGDAVNEDFRGVASGSLPRGWDGVAYTRTYDEKASRACLELRRKEGSHCLTVPFKKPLAGNCAVEIEFRMDGLTNDYYQRQLVVLWLEGENGQIVPVAIPHDGKVAFSDTTPRDTQKFKPGQINRLRLVRTEDSYALFLNDGDAASTRINYTGQINGMYLWGCHSWLGDPDRAPNLTTRLYSVQAGSVKTGDPAKVGRVVTYENFHARPRGAILPPGWLGDAYSVATDERYDLRALEVNKAESQIYWVVVPKQDEVLGKGRPFAIDLDVRLCGYGENDHFHGDRAQGQEVFLRLEGPGTLPLTVVMDSNGKVRLSGEKETKVKEKWFGLHGTNRLRLIYQNGVVQVQVNGLLVVESKRPPGNYSGFAIGMIGGVPRVHHGFSSKLYAVKLTALPGAEAQVPARRVLAEDFLMTPIGKGPPGWAGENVSCRPGDGRLANLVGLPGLQLSDHDKPGVVKIPGLKLDDDFVAGIEVTHPHELHKDVIGFGLHGDKVPAIELGFFYDDRKYLLQVKYGTAVGPRDDVTNKFDPAKPLALQIERRGNGVVVSVNGQPVRNFPVGKTVPAYQGAQINLKTSDDRGSPHVSQVYIEAK